MAAEDTHAANGALSANHKRGRAQLSENMMDHESPMSLLAVAAMAAEDDPQNSGSEDDRHQGDGGDGGERDGRNSRQKKDMPVRSSSFGRRIRPKYNSEDSEDEYMEEEDDEEVRGGARPFRGVSRYRPDDEDEYDEDDGREYRSVAGSRVSELEYDGQYMVEDDDDEYEEVSGGRCADKRLACSQVSAYVRVGPVGFSS